MGRKHKKAIVFVPVQKYIVDNFSLTTDTRIWCVKRSAKQFSPRCCFQMRGAMQEFSCVGNACGLHETDNCSTRLRNSRIAWWRAVCRYVQQTRYRQYIRLHECNRTCGLIFVTFGFSCFLFLNITFSKRFPCSRKEHVGNRNKIQHDVTQK